MASKSSDVRPKITLACTECKERNYITKKNRRNDPDRMELSKFCPRCRKRRDQRVSRWAVCRPSRGQNFFSSIRSGSLRRFFLVM